MRPPAINGYFLALKKRGLSDVSRYDHYLSLHALFAFLDGTLPFDPLKGWSGSNFPERNRMRACPTEEEMQRALATFADYEKYPGGYEGRFLKMRNEALLRLMIECGLRRGEVIDIRLDDIDRMNRKITVRGKTGQSDVYFFESGRALLSYLGERSSMKPNPQTDKLFVTVRGEPLTQHAVRFTPVGRDWLRQAGQYDYIPVEPGRFAAILDGFSPRFGVGFRERAQEAIRSYVGTAFHGPLWT